MIIKLVVDYNKLLQDILMHNLQWVDIVNKFLDKWFILSEKSKLFNSIYDNHILKKHQIEKGILLYPDYKLCRTLFGIKSQEDIYKWKDSMIITASESYIELNKVVIVYSDDIEHFKYSFKSPHIFCTKDSDAVVRYIRENSCR